MDDVSLHLELADACPLVLRAVLADVVSSRPGRSRWRIAAGGVETAVAARRL